MAEKICAFEGCGPAVRLRRGLCSVHYEQLRTGKPLTPRRWRQGAKVGAECSFAGCALDVKTSGLCKGHYSQRRAGRDLAELRHKRTPGGPCGFGSCGRDAVVSGLCTGHYSQQYAGRPLTDLRERRVSTLRDDCGRKQCRRCNEWHDEGAYSRSTRTSDGLQIYCTRCARGIYLLATYNTSIETYEILLTAQGGVCAICEQPDPTGKALAVDHDHACCPDPAKSCGECVRGLTCWPCNVGLGHFRDDARVLRAAADYLDTNAPRVDSR